MKEKVAQAISSSKGWIKFIAIVEIIGGVLSLPVGILAILAGVFLFQAANSGEKFVHSGNDEYLAEYHEKLRLYFLITGISIIVTAVLLVLITLSLPLFFGSIFSLFITPTLST